jgi:hypothetical protein
MLLPPNVLLSQLFDGKLGIIHCFNSNFTQQITLAQVKVTQNEVHATIAVLDCVPTAHDPASIHFALKQHCSWIEELIKSSNTSNVHLALEAYAEDRDGDGVVIFFCFLQEFLGTSIEALVLAEEALHLKLIQMVIGAKAARLVSCNDAGYTYGRTGIAGMLAD